MYSSMKKNIFLSIVVMGLAIMGLNFPLAQGFCAIQNGYR